MRAAVSFLTSLGGSREPGPGTFDWFPSVGAALGALLGVVWWAAGRAWPAGVAAAVVVAADLGLTGMLHFDGFTDSADGLLAPMERPRRLEVMSSPESGAFAVGAGATGLLLRWAALAAIKPAVLLTTSLWCLSRTAMAAGPLVLPYARAGGGLASAFEGGRRRWPLVLGAAFSIAVACLWKPVPGIVSALAAVAAGAGLLVLSRRRLGGYTGDVLGACGFLVETVGLIVAAAKW